MAKQEPGRVCDRVFVDDDRNEHSEYAFAHRQSLIVNKLGAIPAAELSRPVGSAQAQRDAISNALDYLLKGF